ncbi:hypothetical protein [Pseudoflavonifractor phocaeensis]|uniref:hypothetical protein n=1 Tax=Pseudoflavonifractor phocaeensis TaxID=1870988 RepID=UPI00210C9E01|nr:hypothetical protein [Pseudoflavonifractor phocaeensis]MCQ4864356.1 hypothetical protein [Pseudoflavonifractor phocaeensis]
MKKRIVSLTLALALIFSLSVTASASGPIAPRWDYTDAVHMVLMFSGSTALCNVTLTGKTDVSLMRVTVYLQKEKANGSYANVETWYEEVHGAEFELDQSVPNCESGNYRLYISARVYDSKGNSEGVTGETFAKC